VKVQLVLLGVVVALTLGALTLADSVPTASLSVPATVSASQSPATSDKPEVAAVAAPAAIADTTPATTQVAVTEGSVAPDTVSASAPSGCTTAVQLLKGHGKHGQLTPAKVAQLIAVCAGGNTRGG
jgi:hypothetical protein